MVDRIISENVVLVDDATDTVYKALTLTDLAGFARGAHAIVDVDLSVPTSALIAGDLMADTQVVSNATRANDACCVLESVTVIDVDDVKDAFDLVFLTANTTLGTENAAPTVSDADALNIVQAKVSVPAAGYTDLGGVSVQTVGNIRAVLRPIAGTRNLAIGAIMVTATGQFAGGSVRVRLGLTLD